MGSPQLESVDAPDNMSALVSACISPFSAEVVVGVAMKIRREMRAFDTTGPVKW